MTHQMSVDGHPRDVIEMQPLMVQQQPHHQQQIPQHEADEWEFPRDRLTITTVLGAGAFGVVMRGLAQGIKGSVGQITCLLYTSPSPRDS